MTILAKDLHFLYYVFLKKNEAVPDSAPSNDANKNAATRNRPWVPANSFVAMT
jgi:hypothetical protein